MVGAKRSKLEEQETTMLNEQAVLIFETKTGIPFAPYKEHLIDGIESLNASESFDSGIAYQRNR